MDESYVNAAHLFRRVGFGALHEELEVFKHWPWVDLVDMALEGDLHALAGAERTLGHDPPVDRHGAIADELGRDRTRAAVEHRDNTVEPLAVERGRNLLVDSHSEPDLPQSGSRIDNSIMPMAPQTTAMSAMLNTGHH